MKNTAQDKLMRELKATWEGDPANMAPGVAIVGGEVRPRVQFTFPMRSRDEWEARALWKIRNFAQHNCQQLPLGIIRIRKDDPK